MLRSGYRQTRRLPAIAVGGRHPGKATNSYSQSTVDGRAVRETQLSSLSSGRLNHVPVIQGANSHDGRFFFEPTMTATEYLGVVSAAATQSGKSFDSVLGAYPPTTTQARSRPQARCSATRC